MDTHELPVPVSYTATGNIDIDRTLSKMREVRNKEDLLRRTLEAVWEAGYSQGWNHGSIDIDVNIEENPYSAK